MEDCSKNIIDNIKHEPERHYVLIIPNAPKNAADELKKLQINLTKFDSNCKKKAKMFGSYLIFEKCDFATNDSVDLNKHLLKCKPKRNRKTNSCTLCNLAFSSRNRKNEHTPQEHLNGSMWQCSKCAFQSPKKEILRNHYRTHSKKFSCATCEQKFSLSSSLKSHQMQHRHGVYATQPTERFECDTCDCSFGIKAGLNHHKRNVHRQINFHCDVCGKIVKNKIHLKNHVAIHFKVSCPICQHKITKQLLKCHIEQHSLTNLFKCEVCEKAFKIKSSLYTHLKTVHVVEKVQCDICNKYFRNKELLKSHIKIHLKVPCPICRKPILSQRTKLHLRKCHSSGK